MYRYKKKKGKKKREAETSLNSLARNARTFRKLSLSVRRIRGVFYFLKKIIKAVSVITNCFYNYFFILTLLSGFASTAFLICVSDTCV